MSLKAKLEAIIYATEEPVTLNELSALLKDAVLAEIHAEEDARIALNETVSDGPTAAESEEEEELRHRGSCRGNRRRARDDDRP